MHQSTTIDQLSKPYYSVADLMTRWNVSRSTIGREVDRGRIKAKRIGGQLRFALAEVIRYEAEAG